MTTLTKLSLPYFRHLYNREATAAADVEGVQRTLLTDLVATARHTVWGLAHDFSKIHSYADYRDRVEVAPYATLRPLVMRMIAGEHNVLWPGVTRRYAQSSGTSDGKSKYIPISRRCLWFGHYAGARFSLASYLHYYPDSQLFGGKSFILGGSYANELKLKPGVKVGDLSATLIDCIFPVANLVRIPAKPIALMENWEEKLPALVAATANADVRSISGVPSWFLTVLKQVIASKPGATNIHQLWPNLEVFFHGGIAFGPYRSQYEGITSSAKMRYWENYNASEGFFGVQARPECRNLRLLMNTDVFYEFIPVDQPDAPPIPAWQVKEGEIYALVITSSNGLWRFPLGDTVKIEQARPLEITIAGRTAHFINAFGEEVMVYNTDAALARACNATGAQVLNYTAAPVFASNHSRGRHQWLIEFAVAPPNLAQFATLLDQALQQENSDYQAKRAGGIFLDCLSIDQAQAGLFDRWLATTGKLGGQRKVPRLCNDRRFINPLLQLNGTTAAAPQQH
jgi:hypothetical protein